MDEFLFDILLAVVISLVGLLISRIRLQEVPPSKSVAFQCLGKLVFAVMSFPGHHFDNDWNIQDGDGPDSVGSCWLIWKFGAWVIYVTPFVKVARYEDYNDPDKFGQGVLVNMGDQTLDPVILVAETLDEPAGEGVGLNVKFKSTGRVKNLRKFLTVSPPDIQQQVIDREAAMLRGWVRIGNEDHAQQAKGNGKSLWNELNESGPDKLNCGPVFDFLENKWGFQIIPESVLVEDVGYDPVYQDAKKAQKQQELLAKGETARIFGPLKDALPAEEYAKLTKEEALELRNNALAGSGFSVDKKEIDISSGGQPINPSFAGGLAAAEVVGDAIARAFGKKGPIRPSDKDKGGNKPGNGGKSGGKNPASSSDPPYKKSADDYFKRHGKYPSWDPLGREPKESD